MSRQMGMVCAAALLFAVAGCSAGSFLMSWIGSGGKQEVVSGSVDEVAARLQASLKKIDIIVAINPLGDGTVKLNGQTKSGKRFALVLKRQPTNRGESTAISVEWESEADEQFWATMLEIIASPAP